MFFLLVLSNFGRGAWFPFDEGQSIPRGQRNNHNSSSMYKNMENF